MTGRGPAAPPTNFDDLWSPAHWNDRQGGTPLGAFFVGVLLAGFTWNWIAKLWVPSVAWVPANLAVAACLVAAARNHGLSQEELGLRRDRLARGLGIGLAAAAAILLVLAIALAWPTTRPFFEDARVAADTFGSRVFNPLVRIPLGTVVLEEMLFRGVLLGLALRRWSVVTALGVTSGLFGLWHLVPITRWADEGPDVILGTVVITMLGGLLFGWLRLRANSIVAPMLAHVATNSLGYLAAVAALQLR